MGLAGRLATRFGAGVACVLAFGCGFAQKPYANDPLLRGGRIVWMPRDTLAPVPAATTDPLLEPPPMPIGATSPRLE